VFGTDVWAEAETAMGLLGVLPDNLAMPERLTGREMLVYLGLLRGMEDAEVGARADELLHVLDLAGAHTTLVIEYSAGMRKKIGLASALRRLQRRGPELLQLMRVGRQVETADDAEEGQAGLRVRLLRTASSTCLTLGIIALLAQAGVPTVNKIIGSGERSWFLAMYVPEAWQWPVILAMAALGGALLALAYVLHRAANTASDNSREGAVATPTQ
jgi:hypothetical protein